MAIASAFHITFFPSDIFCFFYLNKWLSETSVSRAIAQLQAATACFRPERVQPCTVTRVGRGRYAASPLAQRHTDGAGKRSKPLFGSMRWILFDPVPPVDLSEC
eukprot:5745269-Pyramimonas_sp.AAC.1